MAAWDIMEQWVTSSLGPIVKCRILGTWAVIVHKPQALKRIFQTGYKIYEKDLELSYHPFLPILGTGLVTADGALWQKQRILMGPALRADVLDDIIVIAHKCTSALCDKIEAFKKSGKPFDIEEEFRLLTLQVIGEAVLSLSPEECDKVFPVLYLPVMEEANRRVLRPYRKYLPIPEWFRFRSLVSQLNTYLINYFRQRWQERISGAKSARPRPDILDGIFDAIQENNEEWTPALETQLCYEVKTFLLAGHETSATMLTWSTYELARRGDVLERIQAEAKDVFGPNNITPSRRQVDGMTYTFSVLKEALRRYSVVPVVTRRLAVDDELLGHKVPKGTMVICNVQATHNQFENPLVFDPERFMPGGEFDKFDDAVRPYVFVPFIQGPRNCLGQHLAMLEARVVLGLLHKRCRFELAPSAKDVLRHPTVVPVGPMKRILVTAHDP
nr:cytochrome P450 (CYP746A1) [Polytomella parva]|eukprot:CAMPEP_0175074420 /NCGR_PEP_ID=MMETSP0052_2-20121109/21296_1 /TAXON_ID=51329 ORGANISM="Polytomella parva, Strain SAG 63-3" /NCGR_SAMPLE_ID=MMETSP0052_2 /ASSEMBLY_ACC=CAM_ASM_000194 /LENGTH=442 /DNA_ID=CAMNT_0016342715 /DNA_START=319 /DNA_END=1647 /DNA_ORIENTATION=+